MLDLNFRERPSRTFVHKGKKKGRSYYTPARSTWNYLNLSVLLSGLLD